ncbi:MAG: sulfotransferase [Thermoplasmatales archaeon]|nr:sulfotransferase [Thermoplasmatales archaeon]
MFKRVIVIAGVPRSGTSWLSQIIDSNPNVCHRYQPIFSYAFKNAVNLDSSKQEYNKFFRDIYDSQDEFLCRTKEKKEGIYPIFSKVETLEVLTFKNVRYHFLLEKMLQFFDNLNVVGIVRHPCAVINSWITTPKEFPSDADPIKEWQYGRCRNTGPEEYWGFEKWREIAYLFRRLQEKFPDQFYLIRYNDLVDDSIKTTKELFKFLNLEYSNQTNDFLISCHKKHDENSYSVFKDKSVKVKWKGELCEEIQVDIFKNIKGSKLEDFLK